MTVFQGTRMYRKHIDLAPSGRGSRMTAYTTLRDFQTWLIRQVTAARGVACQFTRELPVCPAHVVYVMLLGVG